MERFFESVILIDKLGFLHSGDGTILRIGHSYRNAAYHRDSHNHRALKEISRILFRSVCNLCRSFYDKGISIGGFKPDSWLADRGLRVDFINFNSAIHAICTDLLKGLPCELGTSKGVLLEDVRLRVEAIESRLQGLRLADAMIDEGLKKAEFTEAHPWESYSEELRTLNYQIIKKSAPLDAAAYRAAQTLTKRREARALKAFEPKSSVSLLRRIKNSKRLSQCTSLESLLLGYQEIDAKLTQIEKSAEKLVEAFDRAVQFAIDRSRGK